MRAGRVLKGALIVCILLNIHLGIAAEEDIEEAFDESDITVLTSKHFDEVVKPAKHALVSESTTCLLGIN
jgi:hypothetical protein